MRYLTTEDLVGLSADLGVGPVRDLGLLDAAAHRPRATVFGEEAYSDLTTKAAVLMESIVRNHPLVDGNKRLGWLALLVFLGLNGLDLDVADDPAYDLVIGVAEGRLPYQETARRLRLWCDEDPSTGSGTEATRDPSTGSGTG